MQVFRKKYMYNAENPIYVSENVKTFNCVNTQTKDNRLAIVQHLKDPPFVEPHSGTLQPIQIPTMSQPFSVYPLVYCASEVGKVSEPQAMYILKCLLECKLKNPLYYVLSPDGICGSEIQGLLPNKSPSIFNIALQILDIPQNLTEVQKSVISKEGYAIVKGIRDGESVLSSINIYGWKDVKKQKDNPKDSQYWIYKARRKQQGGLNEEYGLAWNPKHGLCRMKYIDLSKDSYETEFYKNYADKVSYFQENDNKKVHMVEIHKCVKQGNGIKVFTSIPNQGSLSQYISKKHIMGKSLTQKNFLGQVETFVEMMKIINQDAKINGFGTLHIKNLFVHNNKITLGEPTLITDKFEKKMRQLKNSIDYYAPEMKQNIILPENLFKLEFEKMDTWFLGFMLHKIYTREVPLFDPARKPIINKQKFSPGMYDLICRCLNLTPSLRPTWQQINIRQLQKFMVMEQVEQVKEDRVEIKLGTRNEQKMKQSGNKFSRRMQEEDIEIEQPLSPTKIRKDQSVDIKSMVKQQQQDLPPPLPMELSSRLKKVKLVTKIVVIMCLYVFVYFLPFLGNSIDILLVRSFYGTTSLHLVDHNGNRLSSTTVITHNPNFFLLNDISFIEIQNIYRCIPDNFNSSDDPSYSLLTYIHSTGFLALLLTGWLMVIVICVIKAVSIWKGGIGNRPSKNLCRYWAVYTFFELSMATLFFAHFYLYHFFYFAGASPCLSYANFNGLDPYFDSSLYLMLSDVNGYLQQVFSTLGILSIFILCSACFYAWGPKLDNKYILSVASIILRFIPFLLFLLICRIGVFMLFSATGINDSTGLLPAVISGSFYGFIGIIPQIFVIICVGVEVLLELFFYWCEAKAAQNDRMAKFFNIRKRKVTNLDDSNDAGLNDMSIVDNSKHHIEVSDD